jgi:hypothetical protein
MTDFTVSDIVYVAIQKKMKIFPAKIKKKITQEDESGKHTALSLEFPNGEERVVSATNDVFSTLDAAKEALLERVNVSIENMCAAASKLEKEYFSKASAEKNEESRVNADENVLEFNGATSEQHLVELPDGTVVKANIKASV